MVRTALAVALAGLALAAAPASALTTASWVPGAGLTVTGDDAGEAVQATIDLSVTPRAIVVAPIPDNLVPGSQPRGATIMAGPGCTQDANSARCVVREPIGAGDLDITASLGGGNDTFRGLTTFLIATPTGLVPGPAAHGDYDGGAGDDNIGGILATQAIRGGDGNDGLGGGPGNDRIEGGPGAINLESGMEGDDTLIGGPQQDLVDGGPGDDRLEGGAGDDTFSPGPGKNAVFGQDGNDSLASGVPFSNRTADTSGADSFSGGNGSDFLGYADRTQPIVLGTDGRAGQAGEGDKIAFDVETVEGGRANDELTLVLKDTKAPATLKGDAGVDRLEAQVPGVATLEGGTEVDKLVGSNGSEVIKARDGVRDSLLCGGGDDKLDADLTDVPPKDCETVTQGATREGSNVAIRTVRAKVRRDGTLPVRLTCPKSLGKLGCAGTLRVASGPAQTYAIRAGKTATVAPELAARDASLVARRGRVLRAMSVERGRFGPKTTIASIRAE